MINSQSRIEFNHYPPLLPKHLFFFIQNKSTQQNTKETNERHLSDHLCILRIIVSRENFSCKNSILNHKDLLFTCLAAFLPTTCFSHTGKLNFKSVVCWLTIKKKKHLKVFKGLFQKSCSLRKFFSIKLRREKIKRRFNAFLKG